jgi:hypothetical protein
VGDPYDVKSFEYDPAEGGYVRKRPAMESDDL